MADLTPDKLLGVVRDTLIETVKNGDDLSARQLSVFLACYLAEEPQTAGDLVAALQFGKATVSHTLDRLTELDLVRRAPNPQDGRSVLVERTQRGNAYLRELQRIMTTAATSGGGSPTQDSRGDLMNS